MEENHLHIPEGWEIVNFGYQNLFKILGSGIKFFEGEKEYYSTSSIEGVKVIFSEGQVTFRNRPSRANMQPIINSIWFAKMKNTLKIFYPQNYDFENVIISTGFCGIFSDKVELDFVKQILLSKNFNSQKNQLAEGSTQEAVNNFKVKQINFYLPKSTTEQTTIASILSKTDQAIAHTEALIAKHTRIKTGLMQDLLTKGIDQNGNIRTEQTHKFKDSPLGRIPKEWECEKLSKYGFFTKGNSVAKSNLSDNGVSCVLYGEIYTKYNFFADTFYSKVPYEIVKDKTPLGYGDILFAGSGETHKDIGKCIAFIGNEISYAGGDIIIFRTNKFNPIYLSYFLNSFIVEKQKAALGQGSSVIHIYPDHLKNLMVVHFDIEEQNKIVEIIKSTDKEISTMKTELSKLQSLKTGLMQDLLSGKVRVKVSEAGFTGLEDKQDYTDKKSSKSSNQANPDTDNNQANPKIKKS